MLKAVLDTQVILRGAAAPTDSITAKIYDAWRAGRFALVLSEPILAEITAVLARPEVLRKLRMRAIEAGALITLLRRRSELVNPSIAVSGSRDPDDDKFLECAVAGSADYVVSADADLLSCVKCKGSRSSTLRRSGGS